MERNSVHSEHSTFYSSALSRVGRNKNRFLVTEPIKQPLDFPAHISPQRRIDFLIKDSSIQFFAKPSDPFIRHFATEMATL